MVYNILDVDYNCDLAQSFGVFENENEEKIIKYMSSAAISCGFHCADPVKIKKAMALCKENNVAIGAHIAFPDIQGFGNRQMNLSADEIEAIVIYQLGAIQSFAKAYNAEIEFVRTHGAMWEMAANNLEFSVNIAKAIKKVSEWLVYYGASGETLSQVEAETNIRTAKELILTQNYNKDMSLDKECTYIFSTEKALNRLRKLLISSEISTSDREYIKVEFDSIHFDTINDNSLELAKSAYQIMAPKPVNYNKVVTSGWV